MHPQMCLWAIMTIVAIPLDCLPDTIIFLGVEGLQESNDRSDEPVVPGYQDIKRPRHRRGRDFAAKLTL